MPRRKGHDRLSIRRLKAGEEAEVCALVARVFDRFVAPDLSPEGVDEFFRFAHPIAMAQRSEAGETVLVAEDRDRLVGMLEMRGCDHIAMLFVETPGRGVGRQLVERALQICRGAPPPADRLTVHASRHAVPIYRRLGFEAEGPEREENGILYSPMAYRLGSDRRES